GERGSRRPAGRGPGRRVIGGRDCRGRLIADSRRQSSGWTLGRGKEDGFIRAGRHAQFPAKVTADYRTANTGREEASSRRSQRQPGERRGVSATWAGERRGGSATGTPKKTSGCGP